MEGCEEEKKKQRVSFQVGLAGSAGLAWLAVPAWHGWRGWRGWRGWPGDEDRVPALSGRRAVLATPRPLPLCQGRKSALCWEQQSSFCNVGCLSPFPTLAWPAGKGLVWGVKFREVGSGA